MILITCDQLRMDTLGCYGDPRIQTPNIDRIARLGTRFTSSFVAAPVCAPNRGSIATGRYPSVHGLRFNGAQLPASERTLMQELRGNGYHTCGVGKMHFGPQWRTPGKDVQNPSHEDAVNPQPDQLPWYGFDRVLVSEDHRVGPYADYLIEHGLDPWADLHSFSYPQHACVRSVYPAEHYQTNWIAGQSIRMIEERPENQPLFLWTSFVDPHHPFNPPAPYDEMYDPADMQLPVFDGPEVSLWPDKYRERYEAVDGSHEAIGMYRLCDEEWQKVRAYYYGMISCIDDAIGRLLKTIERELGLENTVVIFTADHGEMLGDHHLLFKGTMYDQVTRVPLLVAGPGIMSGHICDEIVSTIDLMPSILQVAGTMVPESVQGISFAGGLYGDFTNNRDALLIEGDDGTRSLWTQAARVTWNSHSDRGELFDHVNDPC
ncbi:MAG: sulfatase family protein, partial [Puniceicoccales bacterium]